MCNIVTCVTCVTPTLRTGGCCTLANICCCWRDMSCACFCLSKIILATRSDSVLLAFSCLRKDILQRSAGL